MSEELSFDEMAKQWHGTQKSYLIGLVACFLLTSASFFSVWTELFPPQTLMFVIAGLALVQAVFQLIFFLHLGKEKKPRWETVIFFSMLTTLFVIVVGSLWIMHDLNQRTMPADLMEMRHD